METSDYIPGGAPQAAILALKHFISLLLNRLVALSHLERTNSIESVGDSASRSTEENPVDGSDDKADVSVEGDWSVQSVNLANFAQLALHQIHRSGGSELFWYDMRLGCSLRHFSISRSIFFLKLTGGSKAMREVFRVLLKLRHGHFSPK